MADQREPTAVRILGVAAALEILLSVYISTVGAELNRFIQGQPQVFWLVLDLVLLWLVARGSPVAQWTLMAITGLPLLIAVTTMFPPTWYLGGLVAIGAGELVCLLSPPVRRHTSQGRRASAAQPRSRTEPG